MKNLLQSLLPALALLGAILSCSKNASIPALPGESGAVTQDITRTGTLFVQVENGTKASVAPEAEKAVHSLQVFVFNAATGKRETDKFVEASSLQITAPLGEKHIWAVVNHERFLDMPTEEKLRETVSDLSDNYAGNALSLVMAGSKTVNVEQKDMPLEVNVTRLTSRISLKNVTVKLDDTYLKGCTFTIKDIYLKNVAGDTNFSLEKTGTEWNIKDPTVWYNKMKLEDAPEVNPLILDRNLSIACPEGQAKLIDKVWYTYPNPSQGDSNSASWSARKTRLVIHAEIVGYGGSGAIQSYYTFTLPVLKRNFSYEISNITFTMLGKDNDNDDSVTDTGVAAITLKVAEWDSGTAMTYNM